jgi:hypothetical protein
MTPENRWELTRTIVAILIFVYVMVYLGYLYPMENIKFEAFSKQCCPCDIYGPLYNITLKG